MVSEYAGHAPLAGRFSDIDTKPGAMRMPIEGYENMPLVSLEEAIEPLVLLVRDVRRTASIVKQRCQNPPDNLSPDESAAIMLYTSEWEPQNDSLYFILNSTLRTEHRVKLKPWFLYLKLILTALERLPPIGVRTVYRGIRRSMGDTYPQGKTFTWWGFSSCTTSIDVLEAEQFFGKTGPRTLFNIECKSGRCIRGHSFIERENEVLLLPAIQLKVVACLNQSNEFHIIQLAEIDSSLNIHDRVSGHRIPDVISPPSKSPRKFSSVRHMSIIKAIISSRKPEIYHNLKLEKTIAKYEPRSLIDLDRQSVTDQDIPMVVQQALNNKQCTMLRLSDNKITLEGVSILTEALHNNTTLEGLYIFNNRVGDKGVYSFAQVLAENNSTLTTLSLGYNGITDEGAEYLAEILKKNRTLSELWLPWNKIGDRGVGMLADALTHHNTSLKRLSLDMNDLVTDSSVTSLIDMINQNQSLNTLHMRDCKLSKTAKAKLHEVVGKSKKKFELNL